jgi:hypothetical protein
MPPALAQQPARALTVGVVQLALEPDLAGNLGKIVRFVAQANGEGCRVVVFPETALYSPDGTPQRCTTAGRTLIGRWRHDYGNSTVSLPALVASAGNTRSAP